MLSIWSRTKILKHLKCFNIDLLRKSSHKYRNYSIRSDVTVFKKFNSPRVLSVNQSWMSTNTLQLRKKFFLEQLDDKEKFNEVLETFKENENQLSVGLIGSVTERMLIRLDDLLLEDHHKEALVKSESFIQYLDTVNQSMTEMPARDLINFLKVCRRLNVKKRNLYYNVVKKFGKNFPDLTFSEKVYLWKVLPFNIMKDKLKNIIKMQIKGDIQARSCLDSRDDLIAALLYLSRKTKMNRFSRNERIDVLKGILDLEKLDDVVIFKHFLTVLSQVPDHNKSYRPIKERYFERIAEEIDDHNFLTRFLANYASVVSNGGFHYDGKLIDDVVSKIMEKDLKAKHVQLISQSLAQLRHTHYDFTRYLIDFMEKNPNLFAAYPTLSSRVIPVIASSNCNSNEKNRWGEFLTSIKNSPGLVKVAENLTTKPERHLYFLIELASLGIFIDEDLRYISRLVSDSENIENYYMKILKFFMILDQAVKILYPDFKLNILSNFNLSLIKGKFKDKNDELFTTRMNFLEQVGKCLESSTGVQNCFLMNCRSKSNVDIHGIVGINKEGKLLDFSPFLNKEDVFVEDIASSTDYKLVTLMFIFEKECSRNTMDLNPAWALGLRILENLGYPTLIIYETVWNHLTGDKGNYMYNKILQESRKNKLN